MSVNARRAPPFGYQAETKVTRGWPVASRRFSRAILQGGQQQVTLRGPGDKDRQSCSGAPQVHHERAGELALWPRVWIFRLMFADGCA